MSDPQTPFTLKDIITGVEKALEPRFSAIDARFNSMDDKFNAIDARFSANDAKFNSIDARFNSIDDKFTRLEKNLKSHIDMKIEHAIDSLALSVGKGFNEMDERFKEIRSDIKCQNARLDKIEGGVIRKHQGFFDGFRTVLKSA